MNFNVRHRLLRLEHQYVSEAPENEPRLTTAELAEMMRQYRQDPHVLSVVDQQRCASIEYVTNPESAGYRPAIRAALGLAGGSAA